MSLTTPDAQQRRTFEAEDVFFSVTDPKGVITHANQTFLRLADLTAAQAIGSPHNVIRHPQMPGGAFRLIWDELGEGRPVCLYMANEARDGLRYDVVATVAPIDGGYLSVRLRPGVPELESAVFTAYDAAAAVEADERAAGASRHEAAQEGSTALLACLGELGFSSLAEFTRHVLPREIEAFLAVVPPAAPDPAAGALGLVLASTAAIARSITPFVARLGDYEQLAQRVLAERASIAPAIAELTDLAVQISRVGELVDQNAASAHSIEMTELSELTQRMVGWLNDAIAGFEALPAKLEPLQIALRDLAMRTSMVVLLNHVLGQFTAEVIASGQERGTEVRLLHGALAGAGGDRARERQGSARGYPPSRGDHGAQRRQGDAARRRLERSAHRRRSRFRRRRNRLALHRGSRGVRPPDEDPVRDRGPLSPPASDAGSVRDG